MLLFNEETNKIIYAMKMIKKTVFFLILLTFTLSKSHSQNISTTSTSKVSLKIPFNTEVFNTSTYDVPFEQLSMHKFNLFIKILSILRVFQEEFGMNLSDFSLPPKV